MVSIYNQFLDALHDHSIYDHSVQEIKIIETHISWIVLTGDYAYKIKKPIKYSFIDFSTLEKRRFFCYEELRLNRRLAPDLYIEVVPIVGSLQQPLINMTGEAVEYAVKMRQFAQTWLLSYLSEHDQLLKHHIDSMAQQIADFHLHIDKCSTIDKFGSPEDICSWVADNFTQIESNSIDENFNEIEKLKKWSENEFRNKYNLFQIRKNNKFIRECHGDMHLNNMVLIKGTVTIFDGIEFNEHLRWIDVISEVAFVTMDLYDRGHSGFASRFLNAYLQHTGDYSGLALLKYYLVYRAMVRAKVSLLRIAQKNLKDEAQDKLKNDYISYLTLALQFIKEEKLALIITHGFSGSGKSMHTEKLLELLGAIRIRSDVERKRLFGFNSLANTMSGVNEDIYSYKSSEQTYVHLAELAKIILKSGLSVIVDACFLQQEQRIKFYNLAKNLGVTLVILDFHATTNSLKQRVFLRSNNKLEVSEADLKILDAQLSKYTPLESSEENYVIKVDTEKSVDMREIASEIKYRMKNLL